MSASHAVPVERASALSWVAFVASWPLSLLGVVAGSLWRLLAFLGRGLRWGRNPERGWAEGWRRVTGHARQGLRYLTAQSDEYPRLDGTVRVAGQSYGPWHEARRRLRRNRVALVCWTILAVYLAIGIAAQGGLIASSWSEGNREAVNKAPHWLGGADFMGTDIQGRSVGQLGIRGIATALLIGTFSAVLACLVGGVLGAIAGYFGGWVDDLVVWFYTTLESIPEMLLVMALAFVFKQNTGLQAAYKASFLAQNLEIGLGLFVIILACGFTFWTGVARQIRGEFIRQRDRDYVTAARALGVPTSRIIFRHVFPNVFHLLLISFSLLFIGAIKYEVVLSFLGVGVDPGEASWGAMISQAKLELLAEPPQWWQLSWATVMLFGLVLCVNLFTDALRDALDPRLRA